MDRRSGGRSGVGSDRACKHDEAVLRSAGEHLRRAEEEARRAERLSERGGHAEWSGTAGDSYRARVAFVVAELAAVTAGIVGLGVLAASLERETQECLAVQAAAASSASDAAATAPTPRLPITQARGPLLPYVPRGPLIPQEARSPLLPVPSPASPAPRRADEVCR